MKGKENWGVSMERTFSTVAYMLLKNPDVIQENFLKLMSVTEGEKNKTALDNKKGNPLTWKKKRE